MGALQTTRRGTVGAFRPHCIVRFYLVTVAEVQKAPEKHSTVMW